MTSVNCQNSLNNYVVRVLTAGHNSAYPKRAKSTSRLARFGYAQNVMPHATKRQNSNKINKTHE